uniref:ZP domain-containing protein n=1 Tax=Heterorhabditis bacteriophora TaxID=37862 RepID=A0A1I7WU75_HETBA
MSLIYKIVILVLCNVPLAILVPTERQRHYEISPESTSSSPIDCKGGWIFEADSYDLVGGWNNCTANVMVENGVIAIVRLRDQRDCNRIMESDYIMMDMCKNGEYVFGPGVHSFTYSTLPEAHFRFSARYQKTLFREFELLW